MVLTKILNITIIFNIDDNQKYFLRTKLAYSNYFWRIMWLKTGVMMLKISFVITGINWLKYNKNW